MISKDDFANGDGVVAKPVDKAGNSSTQTVFTIAIDDIAPTIRLNTPKTKCVSPADAEDVNTVNGTITFAGTTDETSMDRLELYWSTNNSTWSQSNLPETEKTGAQSACRSLMLMRVQSNSLMVQAMQKAQRLFTLSLLQQTRQETLPHTYTSTQLTRTRTAR